MKYSLSLVWIACLLIAVGCNGPKNAAPEDAMGALTLKTYDPVSVFVLEEHHPAAARFSVIDMHSHAYRNDEAGIRQWAKTLDENNIEKVIVLTKAFGEEFDRLYDLFTGISDKFELWCGFDMTKWDQPEFPECAVKELERCFAKGAGGVVDSFVECVERHPNTTFIACHLLNINHDYARLGKILDSHPNLWIDISARHQETCVTPRATRRFYEKYQDRILFGTDNDPDPSMYHAQWRILETEDEHFYLDEQSYHWPMQGIGLSDEVLRKIYHDNAVRLLSARKIK
ncbi:MAG: amidohydrolase family protein [Bacteroidales bacterium]|nr:amidohydrolase family protein [Bacteroidales bacterium]